MEFRTKIEIGKAGFKIQPCEEVLLVGSCFAAEMGQRFKDNGFPATVNPYGTMYNPVSILHTVERMKRDEENGGTALAAFKTVFLTLGTNHVYREKATGLIVDNCQKRPAALFQEEVLSIDECADCLRRTVSMLRKENPEVRIVFTVSPIRYRKYGYHQSQLSKATLLLAVNQLTESKDMADRLYYFPAYEIVMDELRDYRFYAADMLHPSAQAVDYVWERLVDTCFSAEAKNFLSEWRPVRQALAHRPLHADSEQYRLFAQQTQARLQALKAKYPKISAD